MRVGKHRAHEVKTKVFNCGLSWGCGGSAVPFLSHHPSLLVQYYCVYLL